MRRTIIAAGLGLLLAGAISSCGMPTAVPASECVIRTSLAGSALVTRYYEPCTSVQAWDPTRTADHDHNVMLDQLPTSSPICNAQVDGHRSTLYMSGDDPTVMGVCDALRAKGLTTS
jgi:hypothetical protein